jgi:hypothetical protein
LRCIQTGIPLSDLDLLDVGMVLDILAESRIDNEDSNTTRTATQADMDAF